MSGLNTINMNEYCLRCQKVSRFKLKKKDPFISLHSVDSRALLLWEGEFKPQSLNNPQTQHQWRGDADLHTHMHTHLCIYLKKIFIYLFQVLFSREKVDRSTKCVYMLPYIININ